jgi:hypothetical protein
MSWADPSQRAIDAVYRTFRRCASLDSLLATMKGSTLEAVRTQGAAQEMHAQAAYAISYADEREGGREEERRLVELVSVRGGDGRGGSATSTKDGGKRGKKGGKQKQGTGQTIKFTIAMAQHSISNTSLAFCRITAMLEMQVR